MQTTHFTITEDIRRESLKVLKQISREKELIELMKAQITDSDSALGYLNSKLKGLRCKSKNLSKFLLSRFKTQSNTVVCSTESNSFPSISLEKIPNTELSPRSLMKTIESGDYYEDVESEMKNLSLQLYAKDQEIEKLKQTIDDRVQEKETIVSKLEDKIIMLEHGIEIQKHHIKMMRDEIQRMGEKLLTAEKDSEDLAEKIREYEEKNLNLNGEVQTLIRKIEENEERIKKFERLSDFGADTSSTSAIDDPFLLIEQLQNKLNKLKEENFKLSQKRKAEKSSGKENYDTLLSLYTKTLKEREKQVDIIQEQKNEIEALKGEVLALEDKIVEIKESELNAKIGIQGQLMERISILRREKHELKKRLADFASKEMSGSLGKYTGLALVEEAEIKEIKIDEEINDKKYRKNSDYEEVEGKENKDIGSVVSFRALMENTNPIYEEEGDEYEDRVKELKSMIEDYKKDLEMKDKEIFELREQIRISLPQVQGRKSILVKIRPNPIVLELFGKKDDRNFP
jgi:DNA repair exonuclease SbcCD ATPase subunit